MASTTPDQTSDPAAAEPTMNTREAVAVAQRAIDAAIAATAAADIHIPFSITYLVPNLVIGTAYWIDLAAESVTTVSQMGFANVSIVAMEQ